MANLRALSEYSFRRSIAMIVLGKVEVIPAISGDVDDFGKEVRFFVKIGGKFVAPLSMPNQGYRSRSEARYDAYTMKRDARKRLKRNK